MITTTIDHHRATITLDAPRTRNALPMAGWHALAQAVARIAQSNARVVVVQSAAEGMFCAGSDLKEIAALADNAAARAPFRQAMRDALDGLAALAMPVIAAVDGDCFGAGVALALAADIRVAGPRAVFAITPAKLGITYPGEDVARLRALVGPGQAARLLYAADPIGVDEALRIGLAEIAGDAAVAGALSETIAARSPASLAALKRTLADPADAAHDAAFDAAFAGADFREGLAAFRERRTPRFG